MRRRALAWFGSCLAVVVFALGGCDGGEPSTPAATPTPAAPGASPTPEATATASPSPAPTGPALRWDVSLRSAPDSSVSIVARLDADTPILLVGRSQDGGWLALSPQDDPATLGWVRATSVVGGDVEALPVIETGGGATATPSATATAAPSDLPDLVLERAWVLDNRLMVEVRNAGRSDVTGALVVAVDGGEPRALDVKPGEPLRPDTLLEAAVPGEYVLREREAVVEVSASPDIEEADDANNRLEVRLAPDLPNDLAVADVQPAAGAAAGVFVAVRNNGPVPFAGEVAVTLLATPEATEGPSAVAVLDLPPGETRVVELATPGVEPDLSTMRVRIASDDLDDGDASNDVWPR